MIVGIESASSDPSIALAGAGGQAIHVEGWSATPRQAHELLPRLEAALRTNGAELHEISAIGVGIGPGSFTGLRVGMSVAKGLAFALGRPIVGVLSLPAWLDSEPGAAGAVTRAGASDAYLLLRGEEQPRIADRDALPNDLVLVAPEELAEAFGLASSIRPRRAAAAVALATWQRLAKEPAGDDLAGLEPMYLRAPRGVPGPAGQASGGG